MKFEARKKPGNKADVLFTTSNAEILIRNVPLPEHKERNVTPNQKQLEEKTMRLNDRVITPVGHGKILSREADTGILRDRYCVELDNPDCLDGMALMTHNKYGGVYFHKNELKLEVADEIKPEDA